MELSIKRLCLITQLWQAGLYTKTCERGHWISSGWARFYSLGNFNVRCIFWWDFEAFSIGMLCVPCHTRLSCLWPMLMVNIPCIMKEQEPVFRSIPKGDIVIFLISSVSGLQHRGPSWSGGPHGDHWGDSGQWPNHGIRNPAPGRSLCHGNAHFSPPYCLHGPRQSSREVRPQHVSFHVPLLSPFDLPYWSAWFDSAFF